MPKYLREFHGLDEESVRDKLESWASAYEPVPREEAILEWKLDRLPGFFGFHDGGRIPLRVTDLGRQIGKGGWWPFWAEFSTRSNCHLQFSPRRDWGLDFSSNPETGTLNISIWSNGPDRVETFTNLISVLQMGDLVDLEEVSATEYDYRIRDGFCADRQSFRSRDKLVIRVGADWKPTGRTNSSRLEVIGFPLTGLPDRQAAIDDWLARCTKRLKVGSASVGTRFGDWEETKPRLESSFTGPWSLEAYGSGDEVECLATIPPNSLFPLRCYALGWGVGLVVDAIRDLDGSFSLYLQSSEPLGAKRRQGIEAKIG